jgi:hypothetical protein
MKTEHSSCQSGKYEQLTLTLVSPARPHNKLLMHEDNFILIVAIRIETMMLNLPFGRFASAETFSIPYFCL